MPSVVPRAAEKRVHVYIHVADDDDTLVQYDGITIAAAAAVSEVL